MRTKLFAFVEMLMVTTVFCAQQPVGPGPSGPDQETIIRLQIFLDQHSFGPGKIDGHWSEFTTKALQRYQMSNGNEPTGQITPEMQDQLKQMSDIYTNYQLTDDDFKRLGKAPQRPPQQAKMKQLPYRSITDFVAERFHSGEEFIKKLNAGRKMSALKPGDNLRVPNVQPFRIETFKRADDLPISQALAGRVIKVDTHDRVLDVIDGDTIIGSYPITPGSKTLPAPLGTWKVVRITMLPWFRWDEAMLRHGRRSGDFFNIPPGPRNPVGIAWIGLNKKGVGIHGTNHPDVIGRSASHGCIRLANWDAARVANQVTDGTTVEIF